MSLLPRALLLGCGLVACAGAPAAPLEQEASAIVDGTPSGAEDNAVVALHVHQSEPPMDESCAGTLIAKDLVLTALHCVAAFSADGRFECQANGSLKPPDTGYGWIGAPLPPGNITVYVGPEVFTAEAYAYGSQIFGSGGTEICVDDLALVALDRELPASPMPVRLDRGVTVGETISVLGYGPTAEGGVSGPRTRLDGVVVGAVGPDDLSHGAGLVVPRAFTTNRGPCTDDYGGPALSQETGAIVGVFSRGGPDCALDGTRLFTEVAPFASLIHQAAAAVGATLVEAPGADAPRAPGSNGCATNARGSSGMPVTATFAAALLLLSRSRQRTRRRARILSARCRRSPRHRQR